MLSGYAKNEWLTITAVGLMFTVTFSIVGWYIPAAIFFLAMIALLLFFRDPDRAIPTQRGVITAPADGRISSIHTIDYYEPFGEPAVCIRIFLSVLDVHINRCPCHCTVGSITYKAGAHLNVLNPKSAEENENVTIILNHPTKRIPVAAVRQVAGLLARTIVTAVREDQTLQRGQRIGIIKFGSTTEVYLPARLEPRLSVQQGQYVYGGATIVAHVKTSAEHDNPTFTDHLAPLSVVSPDDSAETTPEATQDASTVISPKQSVEQPPEVSPETSEAHPSGSFTEQVTEQAPREHSEVSVTTTAQTVEQTEPSAVETEASEKPTGLFPDSPTASNSESPRFDATSPSVSPDATSSLTPAESSPAHKKHPSPFAVEMDEPDQLPADQVTTEEEPPSSTQSAG